MAGPVACGLAGSGGYDPGISERDREASAISQRGEDLRADYRGARLAGRVGFGRSVALIVVDFIRAYTDPDSPLYAPPVLTAIAQTKPLLTACRERVIPVLFTRVAYHPDLRDAGLFIKKARALCDLAEGSPQAEIVPDLRPGVGDHVITKQYASAFFGTSLASTLRVVGVDTVLLAGCTTSGCIRATAVDGLQHGFHVIVPRECVADRDARPHEANLFDIDAKYGDVLGLEEVLAHLGSL